MNLVNLQCNSIKNILYYLYFKDEEKKMKSIPYGYTVIDDGAGFDSRPQGPEVCIFNPSVSGPWVNTRKT